MYAYRPERNFAPSSKKDLVLRKLRSNPAMGVTAFVSLLALVAIMVNAIWFQPVQHPSPLFATRILKAPEKLPPTATVKRTNTQKVAASDPANPSEAEIEILREVQSLLSVRGYYGGKVDGKYGSKTRKAILLFQADHNLEQDGKPSVRLLSEVLMSARAKPAEVPLPKSPQVAQKVPEPQSVKQQETPVADGLVARIQAGLRAYGYDELEVDGLPGRQTRTAIQRFQLDYGMKITGEPSERILEKLREIGAFRQG